MSDSFAQGFGQRLRRWRLTKGLRQEDLGRAVGVRKSAVSQWESGDRMPSIEVLRRLADYLDVSADYLCGRDRRGEATQASMETAATHRAETAVGEPRIDDIKSLEEFREYISLRYGMETGKGTKTLPGGRG